MNIATTIRAAEELKPDLLTEAIVSKLGNPQTTSDFDFHGAVNDVLKDVGLSTTDSGGKLTFYGRDRTGRQGRCSGGAVARSDR